MRRNIFHVEIITTYKNKKMTFQIASFEETLNYFKLKDGWLNSKCSAKSKLSHSAEKS